MAIYDEKGQLTYKDEEGNLHRLHPKTKMDCVDGLVDALGGKAPAGLHRSYGSLKDIGITTFPTTMATVVSKMPANSMIVIDTRRINGVSADSSTETISDWGSSVNGMALIMKGYSNARVSMIIVYGTTAATVTQFNFGNYASTTDTVNWSRCASYDNFVDFVKKTSPRNLLDNSDFRNPVNQRGQDSYTGAFGYCIDRWTRSANATVNVTSGGVKIVAASAGNGMFSQSIIATPDMVGKKFTLAYCLGNGSIGCVTFPVNTITVSANTKLSENIVTDGNSIGYVYMLPGGIMQVQFLVYSSKTATIQWAALYEGEYTTETLPEYKSKGYAAELAECQRYYLPNGEYSWSTMHVASGYAFCSIKLPVTMRVIPSIIENPKKKFMVYVDGWTEIDLSLLSTLYLQPGEMTFTTHKNNITNLQLESGKSYLISGIPALSADL